MCLYNNVCLSIVAHIPPPSFRRGTFCFAHATDENSSMVVLEHLALSFFKYRVVKSINIFSMSPHSH